MTIEEAIENVYAVFSKYTTANMYYCDCGCIDPEDIKQLMSGKLRELNEDVLWSYNTSALYTWGDLEHYKHFLPRILEVYSEQQGVGSIDLSEIKKKVEYAKWDTWDQIEIQAIKAFVLADWKCFINESNADIDVRDLESYAFFFPLKSLLDLWDFSNSTSGLKNLVHFFYYNGTNAFHNGLKLNGKVHQHEFAEFINQKEVRDNLEKAFFEAAEVDKDYASDVSDVMYMIEQAQSQKL